MTAAVSSNPASGRARASPPPTQSSSSPGPRPTVLDDIETPKTRFALFCDIEQIFPPSPRPGFVRTHNALLAAEWAKETGGFDALNEEIYRAYWERCENIESIEVLAALAEKLGLDGSALAESVRASRHDEKILHFDDGAYRVGVRHVPTFLFGAEELLAEAHYVELKFAAERFFLRRAK